LIKSEFVIIFLSRVKTWAWLSLWLPLPANDSWLLAAPLDFYLHFYHFVSLLPDSI